MWGTRGKGGKLYGVRGRLKWSQDDDLNGLCKNWFYAIVNAGRNTE